MTVETADQVQGWTEKNYFAATEEVKKMKGLSEAKGADFRIFRLTLVQGKIYSNRILEKDANEKNPTSPPNSLDSPRSNGSEGLKALAKGGQSSGDSSNF